MKKIFTIINLIFIFFIIDFSISAFYEYFAREFEMGDYSKTSDVLQQKFGKKSFKDKSYYKTVAGRDLFRTEKVDKSEDKQNSKLPDKEIQLTTLNFELKGTITGTGSEPFAIIKKKRGGEELLYTTGDSVDQAVIKKILRERVVLLVDGKEEILLMGKSKIQKDSNKSAGVPTSSHKDKIVNNVLLTETDVDKLSKDLENLKKHVRVRPHFYQGKIDGFRVTGIKQDSVFYKKLGLRNGDVVAAVNEKEIKSRKEAIDLYNKFKQMNGSVAMEIDIKRNGLPEKIRYTIE